MRIPPLQVLLTWPAPNYVDPDTRGSASLIVNIICILLVITTVGLRFYCRMSIKQWFGLDDTMIALSLLFTIGLTVAVLLADQRYGWDRHVWDIPAANIRNANIIAMVSKILFTFAATFTRLSLCSFYYRLVKDSGIVWFQWVVHANVAFTLAVCITFVCLSVFLCTPVPYYWEYPPTGEGQCLDEGVTTLIAGVLNLAADLSATLVPVPLVMRLRMPLKQRIGVCVLFGLGFVVIIAGAVRTYFIWKGLMDSYDETWYAYPLWIAASVEIDVGVICACAPALKTLFHFSHNRQRLPAASPPIYEPRITDKSTPTVTSTRHGVFNATRSLPWSSRSRSQKGSVKLEDQSLGTGDSWPDMRKTQARVLCGPRLDYSDGSDSPVLGGIMRRDSVELESLRQARTSSTMSHHRPRSLPEEHDWTETMHEYMAR